MSSALRSLVLSIIPASRTAEDLKEDIVSHCQEILNRGHEADLSQVVDFVKRRLLATSPNGSTALKFSNLLSRLLNQPVLSRKTETIMFLYSLASSPAAQPSAILLPLLTSPPHQKTPVIQQVFNDASKGGKVTVKSKATLLRDYRSDKSHSHLPESLLLRDALYLLQGISGKFVRFSLTKDEENRILFVEDAKWHIPASTQALIHRLAELGYLYSRIERFVQAREGANGVGTIEQSLCHHLHQQLTEYYRLIAMLETQISKAPQVSDDSRMSHDGGRDESGLSLRRLDVWVNEWRLRMRMMSVCVEGARDTHGGALVNLIHSYTDNGDPFVRMFTDKLLEEVSRPFFATLHKWLFSGELYDPFSEFFVAVDANMGPTSHVHPSSLLGGVNQISGDGGFTGIGSDDDFSGLRENGVKLWEAKYRFRKEMLPMFVGESFGRKIFSTGKSLNFIRYSCHDSDWVLTREKMSNTGGVLQYNDIGGLERSIDTAYRIASHRLFEVFVEKFRLLDHLSALKNYLLLGHGDFADQLMETLGPSLARPANTLYRHNLTATLESAIRSSNAHKDPVDILRRLDARMLEYSHGEIGWDVFTLEYKVDAPIDTVLDADAMEKYLKLFKHLWQMRRIDKALDQGWMRIVGGARTFLRVPDLEPKWHKTRLVVAEMIHFIRQVEAYCRLEVIECSWKGLIDFLNKKEGDLDALIEAHRLYLDRVAKKVLLWNSKPGKEEIVLFQVKEIFLVILQFRDAADNFYNYCLSESSRRDQHMDADRGVYTGNPQVKTQPQDALPGLLSRLNEYGSAYSDRVQLLVQHLLVHPDLDCRFLGIRLSFSEFYKSKKDQNPHQQRP